MPRIKLSIDKDVCTRLVLVQDDMLRVSQSEMASICGVSQSLIAKIRNGDREVSTGIIKSLFIKKNISPMFMIAGILPIEYKKRAYSLDADVQDLKLEVEMLKAEFIKMKTGKRADEVKS